MRTREARWEGYLRSFQHRLVAYALSTGCGHDEAVEIAAEVWCATALREADLASVPIADILRDEARRVCARHVRARRHEVVGLPDSLDSRRPNQLEELLREEDRLACRSGFDWWVSVAPLLSEHQRLAVNFRLLWGWPFEQVSWAVGCSEATARVHFHRGLAKLRALAHGNPPARPPGPG